VNEKFLNHAQLHSKPFQCHQMLGKIKNSEYTDAMHDIYRWNNLPANVTSAPSLLNFRKRLKLHLFRLPYTGLVL